MTSQYERKKRGYEELARRIRRVTLYPHIAVFDDGRGITLGRIARITLNRAFDPAPRDMLSQQMQITPAILFRKQRLSVKHVSRISRIRLARPLGKIDYRALIRPQNVKPSFPIRVFHRAFRRVLARSFAKTASVQWSGS